jgi:hypothetical protein
MLYKEIYLIERSLLFTSKRLMTVLRWTVTFDLHISGNEKQKFFVDTYQTNFELCLPHANKSSSFHGICSSYWLGLDLQYRYLVLSCRVPTFLSFSQETTNADLCPVIPYCPLAKCYCTKPVFVNLLRSPGIDSQPWRAWTPTLFVVPAR